VASCPKLTDVNFGTWYGHLPNRSQRRRPHKRSNHVAEQITGS